MQRLVEHDEQREHGAFFIMQDGKRVAELTYQRVSPALAIIDHTLVIPSLRGQGIARHLLDAAVKWARESHVRFRSTCSYASVQFARDRSIADVVA